MRDKERNKEGKKTSVNYQLVCGIVVNVFVCGYVVVFWDDCSSELTRDETLMLVESSSGCSGAD